MIAESIYVLCAVTSLFCFVLLFRGYLRVRTRILFFGAVSFLLFSIGNVVLVADLIFLPQVNLLPTRNVITLLAVALLAWGLISEK
jgi:hypothetical protein